MNTVEELLQRAERAKKNAEKASPGFAKDEFEALARHYERKAQRILVRERMEK